MGVRDTVVIGTKVYLRGVGVSARDPQARDAFREVAEASLRRLQTDHVDILYYHSVDSAEDLRAEGPLQALAELKKEGKARFIGVSTHQGTVVLPEAVRLGVFDVGLVPVNYTMASNRAPLDAIDKYDGESGEEDYGDSPEDVEGLRQRRWSDDIPEDA